MINMDSFNQAPDYASELEKSFEAYNASLNRNEALARQNDQRRIQSAGNFVKTVQGLANFSVTAKSFLETREEKKIQKARELGIDDRITDLDQDFEDTLDMSKDLYSKEIEVEQEAIANGDLEVAQNVQFKTGHLFQDKFRAIHHLKYGYNNWFISSGTDKKLQAAKNRDEALRVIDAFETRVRMVSQDHLSPKMIKKYINPFLAEKRRTVLETKDKQIAEGIIAQRREVMKADLGRIFKGEPEELLSAVSDWKQRHKGAFSNDKELSRYVFTEAMASVEENESSPEIIEMLLKEITVHKGTGKPTEIQQIMKENERKELEIFVEEKKRKILDKNLESIETQRLKYGLDFKKREAELLKNENRRFTEAELKQEIANWREQSVHPLPEQIKTALSVEDQVEEGVVDRLVYKYANKIPIYPEDLIGLQDPDKIRYWTPLQVSSAQWSIPQNLQDEAKESIKGTVDSYLEVEDGNKTKSPKWIAVKQNAERRYLQLYAEHIPKSPSPDQAHLKALEQLEKEIGAGLLDKRPSSNPINDYALNLELAHKSIANNRSIIDTAVIPGTEEALKQAIANPNEIPKLYKDIASKYKDLTPHELMYYQMEAAGNKVEKDPITKEVEKLEPHVQQLLKNHPTHGRVARALLEEYQKDGDITYDDIEFLLEEVKVNEIKKLDEELKKRGITTPELGALTPQKGDWQSLENGTYVVFDGEQWKQTGVFFTNKQPYVGNIDEYLDKDLINRKF